MTTTAPNGARHLAPRRGRRWIWVLLGVLVVAVVSALIATSGTYALWNGAASTSAATVTAGSASLSIGAATSMNAASLAPGTGVTSTFSVGNTGTVPLSMRVALNTVKVAYSGTTDAATLGALTLHLTTVASASACTTGLAGYSASLASFDTGAGIYTLPASASGVACLELDLSSTAPTAVQGAVVTFSLVVTGTQATS